MLHRWKFSAKILNELIRINGSSRGHFFNQKFCVFQNINNPKAISLKLKQNEVKILRKFSLHRNKATVGKFLNVFIQQALTVWKKQAVNLHEGLTFDLFTVNKLYVFCFFFPFISP